MKGNTLKRSSKPSGKSESWRDRDRRVLWHPFTQQKLWMDEDFPVIVKGKGATLIDADGKAYLDGVSSLWCNIHGHARREINAAMKKQLDLVAHATFLGVTHPSAVELGEKLVKAAPRGLTRVFYSDNGSTAVEVALKMAFQYWQQTGRPRRTKYVTLDAGYHGDTVGAMSVGGIDLFHGVYKPLMFQAIRGPSTYAYRCPKAKTLTDCGRHCLEEIEAILKTHAHEVAALVLEPLIQGAGGMITQPPGFVKSLRALCDRYEVFLIADEVLTGFGRMGRMFACEIEGVTPDFMAVSKGLTGGYLPLAATLTTERVYEGFLGDFRDRRTFFHGHTYTGNPLACAGALAALGIFERENTLEKTRKKIHYMGNLLQDFYMIDQVGDIRTCGLIAGIELVRNPETKEPYPFELRMGHRVTVEARKRGIITRPLGDTLVLMPPLAITDKELEKLVGGLVEATKAAIASVTS
ncbi:MAG TPA: adenosylmethionine--8-amino-7-oxononanoate transaminase [Planctomycetota bacterium]|nr:adenosylmethionine--8-amino-7-oxononanoate transaminase [Planctomycetota bacterium]